MNTSPFHAGEQTLQARVGKREKIESLGRRVIRDYMPDQHRVFFTQLPFLVVGAVADVDGEGEPWATLLPGEPGFIASPDERTLTIETDTTLDDSVLQAVRPGSPVGLLGIDLAARRHNRMNGRITEIENGLTVGVDQAFGNCPRYIQPREIVYLPNSKERRVEKEPFAGLPTDAARLITQADTFFVSSFISANGTPNVEGVDVSHRGGEPGFVRVAGSTLTIPDFSGNNHFNTLGNFLLNPRAGLVFPDFKTGDLLQLTGKVELLDEDHIEIVDVPGAERGWQVIVTRGRWRRNALPFRFMVPDA